MGKFLLSTLLLLTTAFASTAETVYELKFGKDYNSKGVSAYSNTTTFNVKVNNVEFVKMNAFNNSNNDAAWNFVRCGSKSAGTNALITTINSVPEAISQIVINAKRNKSDATDKAKSAKLLVSNSSDFTNPIASYDFDVNGLSTSASDITINLNSPNRDLFYCISIDMDKNKDNGWLQINTIYYNVKDEGAPTECAAPVFTIDGKTIESVTATASIGSLVKVMCPTYGSSISWGYGINNDDVTSIADDIDTFTIPETAQVGDVFTFSATAKVQGETELFEKSSYINVTIIEKKGTRTNPYSVADIIAGGNNLGSGIWVRGFIIGAINSSNGKLILNNIDISSNIALSDSKEGHIADVVVKDSKDIIPIQLSKVADVLNLQDHSDYIGEEVLIYGNNEAYFSTTGIKSTSAYKLLHIAPAIPQLHESVNVSEDNTISGTGTVTVLFTGLDEFTNVYYTFEPASATNGIEAYAAEDHNHTELLYDKENGIKLDSSHLGKTLKAFACDTETGLDSAPVVYKIDITTGVAEIEAAGAGEVRWFDMQGREVKGQPEKGIYVRVANGKASKVIL